MAVLDSFSSLNITKRSSRSTYSKVPRRVQARHYDIEKYGESETSDEDSEYSSDSSSQLSSRDTSASYSSKRPMIRRKSSIGDQRPTPYKLPNRIVRWLCLALISSILIFMLSLVRMSVVSSKKVAVGDVGERPPPPPAPWKSFPFLSRHYGGIRTLALRAENVPEYPLASDELGSGSGTAATPVPVAVRDIPKSGEFRAYANHTSGEYLNEYFPVKECFLDAAGTVRVPKLQYYQGRPYGFPENVMGSYDLLGLEQDVCFERYGRLGPYGYGYTRKNGGTGAGRHGEMEGAEVVWKTTPEVDYSTVNWGKAQRRCYQENAARFETKIKFAPKSTTFSVIDAEVPHQKRLEAGVRPSSITNTTAPKKHLSRTAVVIRSWDDFQYREEDLMHLRAMISELSLGSGGEYDVHLLVQVKDEPGNPIWADDETYQKHLNESVPAEFHDITTLWSETQMLMLYQGIYDTYARGPTLPAHGSYRGLQMAMQHFAHIHPEYDFFWHWEIDIRYTGHYYDLFSKIEAWSRAQPRKGLWERSSRFYIPSVHGSWEDFKQMVRVQTEMGADNPGNIWASINGAKPPGERAKGDKPIWGPERPKDLADWFETENDPVPPTTYERDKYVWGVGEDADLITFNPLFDPEGTTWLLAKDITGYNISEGLPPRRAAIVTSSRMSKRLLNTMHRETAFRKHHAFSEMWAPTAALHHGYKAVYVPHPMYVDRQWPTEYLASIMNAGRNGATGGSRTSVFGDREHNLLGMTWYYNAGFAPNLWRRWLGLKVDNEGGEEFEMSVDEGRDGVGVNGMRGGEGRMCLPPMLIHPVKGVELPVEDDNVEELATMSDPSA